MVFSFDPRASIPERIDAVIKTVFPFTDPEVVLAFTKNSKDIMKNMAPMLVIL